MTLTERERKAKKHLRELLQIPLTRQQIKDYVFASNTGVSWREYNLVISKLLASNYLIFSAENKTLKLRNGIE